MFRNKHDNWKITTIDEIATIKGGKRMPKGKRLLKNKTAHPYIKVKNMHSNKLINIQSDFEFVSESDYERISNYTVESGDLILSIVGTIGLVSIIGETLDGANLTENAVKLSELKDISADYLYYFLNSVYGQYEIKKGIVGSTQPKLPIYNIKQIKVLQPPLNEQVEIVNLLSLIDNKIENNNSIIANLEEQAQAIFKSWFIDFEPFLNTEFVESKIGHLPHSWEIVEVNEWFTINIGKTPPRKQSEWFSTNPCDVKWVSIADMKNISTFVNDSSEYLTEEAIDKFNVKVVPVNSVLLSFKLTIGRVAIVREKLVTNEAIAHFHVNQEYEIYYLYLYLKMFNYRELGNTSSIGTAVNSKIIKAMPIIKPNNIVLSKFHTVVKPLFDMIYLKNIEIKKLEDLRDTLLPKLISGEIRLKEAVEIE